MATLWFETSRISRIFVPALRLVGDDGVARTDLLDDSLRQESFVLRPNELELDRRTAAVQYQDFHSLRDLLSSGGMMRNSNALI